MGSSPDGRERATERRCGGRVSADTKGDAHADHRHPIVIETPIARSADEVFDHLRDHSNQLEWQAGNVKSVAVEPPGPSAAGTRIHKTRRTPMGDLSFTEEMIDLDLGERRWTERTISGGIRGTEITWRVIPTDSGSTVRLEARMAAERHAEDAASTHPTLGRQGLERRALCLPADPGGVRSLTCRPRCRRRLRRGAAGWPACLPACRPRDGEVLAGRIEPSHIT